MRSKNRKLLKHAVALGCEGFQGHEEMRAGYQREFWHTVPILFPIPHRPTKLLVEPAACKSLKILEVVSRALASLLITERGICGNRAESRAAAEATLATSLRFSLGERAKKSQPIRVGTLSIGGGGVTHIPPVKPRSYWVSADAVFRIAPKLPHGQAMCAFLAACRTQHQQTNK